MVLPSLNIAHSFQLSLQNVWKGYQYQCIQKENVSFWLNGIHMVMYVFLNTRENLSNPFPSQQYICIYTYQTRQCDSSFVSLVCNPYNPGDTYYYLCLTDVTLRIKKLSNLITSASKLRERIVTDKNFPGSIAQVLILAL